ncbi:FAD-dependent oxidoreductase [Oerskovia paurometabola]|uniref:FAD-dependent oxidoreductase n=1 Tax=Oerskovia paurometabola TaxID=162170 RepID=A0ABW1X8U3_9CELL|nr:FAD-dependent oxidoreductase [Oerskovia paurometabola]MBM7495972.1 sarcosine oxidase [Oerskovia paurometabola]
MTEHVSHVVVGGGVMGSAAAWQLARAGHDVVLLERFEPGHANGASHGASRIYRTTYSQPAYLDLAQEAFGLWRELERDAGLRAGAVLTLTGGVSHGFPRRTEIGDAFVARGIPHEWLRPEEAAERWPGLRFEGDVLHETETAGRVHADRAVAAFQSAARAHGADVRHGVHIRHVHPGPGSVRVVTDRGDLVAGTVVVAVGAWSTGLLGAAFPEPDGAAPLPSLVVTQEQPAHFALTLGAPAEGAWPAFTHAPAEPHAWPSGVYGLATPGEGIKVGFHGVGPRTDPDRRTFRPEPGQLAQLQDYVRAWVPGADAERLVPVSCTYTTTPDHDFVLDRVGRVVIAAGFSGHGFKFAPSIGRVLAELAREDPDASPEAADRLFSLARFARGPLAQVRGRAD